MVTDCMGWGEEGVVAPLILNLTVPFSRWWRKLAVMTDRQSHFRKQYLYIIRAENQNSLKPFKV